MTRKKQSKKQPQQERVRKVYYDAKQPGSFGGVASLAKALKQKRSETQKWLSFEDTYTLHKPARRKFPRRRTIVGGIDHQW